MTWRDDPSIIRVDNDGNRLRCSPSSRGGSYFSSYSMTVRSPDSPRGWDELLHQLAAVGGRRITGIEDVSRPIEVGDLVHWEGIKGVYEVRYIDEDYALVREKGPDSIGLVGLSDLRHVEVETSEPDLEPWPEVPWVEQGETPDDAWAEFLAYGLDNGQRVERYCLGEWILTSPSEAAGLRLGNGRRVRYRIKTSAQPVPMCRTHLRVCHDENWCEEKYPHDELVCSRHPGHDGPHMACDPDTDVHNLAKWDK